MEFVVRTNVMWTQTAYVQAAGGHAHDVIPSSITKDITKDSTKHSTRSSKAKKASSKTKKAHQAGSKDGELAFSRTCAVCHRTRSDVGKDLEVCGGT